MKAWGSKPVEEEIGATILGIIAVVGTLIVYPTDRILTFLLKDGKGSYLFRNGDFNRETKRLAKSGYIALTKTRQCLQIKITKEGRHALEKNKIKKIKLPASKSWDGRWRLFVFDIPEKHAYSRDAIRRKLKSLGMYNFQRSVLAYPYDCREELDQIAEYYMLGEYYTYIETNYIDVNRELRNHFRL